MEEISNMNFDHLSFSTFMKRLSNWVLNDGIDMGVKLIIGVLVIAIGFKIINNIDKHQGSFTSCSFFIRRVSNENMYIP